MFWVDLSPLYLSQAHLRNGSSIWAEILDFFLNMFGLSTVKISAKSVTSIEQAFAVSGRGLRAMPPKCI